ncbi:aminomethyl-transferring glycine dehydrogenase [Nesterenkonia alkaliphila]|uniref:Glycine dehydrogenase (decarboxylating) n=1 Tax=Nesterenkonia alkaliphila TaxID=1463631 RepID=A0A7K1UJ33_9MICC|nr:aminomethyl-transferring glycine dehydrogenase [Nesterenkonia alkaliphila]MVT26477.1 aminomethyl-transferring glycine dehydrogenase [Nesterenkonia alkaliphila]GFZ81359.1 glycine dehydrogenase (decarboxylating) [Nesterenkonia alkaliphila]
MTLSGTSGAAADYSIPTGFPARHMGPTATSSQTMLDALGYESLSALVEAAVPSSIRQGAPLNLPPALSESATLEALRRYASQNQVKTQMIGQGFYGSHTPSVILRNVLENPAWYTAYTPYQPEISQGRLEALLNYQTMVADLTGLDIANASLLDEASAVAEAILLMRRANKKLAQAKVVVDADIFPQTRAVIAGRAEAVGIELEFVDLAADGLPEGEICGVVLQQPGNSGAVRDQRELISQAKERGALVTVAADLLALTLITPPGEQGADIAVGSSQRFGVPLFFGGPHAAFMAVCSGLQRQLPGRLVGVSKDAEGRPSYRLALQTREQHIRREKATSNICTAQALLAVAASMYGVYHGPEGLAQIARRVHTQARALAEVLGGAGHQLVSASFFDTVQVRMPDAEAAEVVLAKAEGAGINLRRVDAATIGVSTDETTTTREMYLLAYAFGLVEKPSQAAELYDRVEFEGEYAFVDELIRESEYMTHPVFHAVRSETQMMRYLRKLADRDLALDRTMIPLGSCTMKLNAATEMEAISWPEFAGIHPYAPEHQTAGWRALIEDLQNKLAEVTGYAAVSIQPNAGSQGEYAGLLAIRQYHLANDDAARDICLIPASAHGTNASSAVLAGLQVAVVATAEDGTIDLADLDAKIGAHPDRIAAIMITYPSTHGVYESDVREVCKRVHDAGGQVYIDGANLNALVGLAQPGEFGGDVSHLNLHKTFCIPHGGGGPGVGPVAVAEHLVEFLPGSPAAASLSDAPAPVTSTAYGSAGVLPISWAYLAMMGAEGLTSATAHALLSANYIAARLKDYYPTLYTGENGLVAHECILDLRELTKASGITAEDVCKRLIDYGFHAPTLAFPVAGTLMVEPTESEDIAEIERFIEAMIAVHAEIQQVIDGEHDAANSPLKHAPHPAAVVTADAWDRAYTRQQAAYPVPGLNGAGFAPDKYFPPVSRIDGAHGDRNLVCSCPAPEAFEVR